jgi:uncharacterized protein involved in exopolysaccharide biosynthesis
MATTSERLGIVETQVKNLDEKIDDLKTDVKESGADLKDQLVKMYDASCTQHAALSKEINTLKSQRDKWVWTGATALAIIGWLVGHSEKLVKLLGMS